MKEVSGLNDENLIPFDKRTEKELREICSKGGRASQAVQRRRKQERQFIEEVLDLKIGNMKELRKLAEKMGLNADDCTFQKLFTFKMFLNDLNDGNVGTLKNVTALLGEQNETTENNGILDDLAAYLKGDENAK